MQVTTTTSQAGGSGDLDEATIRQRLLDQLWRGLLVLAFLGTPASLARITVTGWRGLYGLHVALAVLIIALALWPRHLSNRLRALMAIAVPAAVAFGGLLTFGFYSAGVVWITISCLIAGICFSRRVMRGVWLGEMLGLAAIAAAFIAGSLSLTIDANDYISQPTAWLGVLTGTLAGVYTLVSGVRVYNDSILSLLETVRAQARLIEHQATHDALTGAPTLRLTLDRLEVAAHQARRQGGRLALLYLDLDGFKQINDHQGHAAGDQVLKVVTARMRERLRSADTLGRIGGDEFIVVAGEMPDRASAIALAQALVACCDLPIEHLGQELQVGVSIGVALFPDDADDIVVLRQRADQAMYRVKRRGKGSVCSAAELPIEPPVSA